MSLIHFKSVSLALDWYAKSASNSDVAMADIADASATVRAVNSAASLNKKAA